MNAPGRVPKQGRPGGLIESLFPDKDGVPLSVGRGDKEQA